VTLEAAAEHELAERGSHLDGLVVEADHRQPAAGVHRQAVGDGSSRGLTRPDVDRRGGAQPGERLPPATHSGNASLQPRVAPIAARGTYGTVHACAPAQHGLPRRVLFEESFSTLELRVGGTPA
jgi:hypothetical protein